MTTKRMLAALSAAAAICTWADTALWYRLDGFAPGEKTVAATRIDNLANPGNDQALCHSFAEGGRGTNAAWMPYGTNGIASSAAIYDPATGILHPRQPYALHFGLAEVTADLSNGHGAFLRLNPSGKALTNVTVEAVFRLAPGDYSAWSFAPIAMQEGPHATDEGWVLSAAGYQNRLCARFRVCAQDGTGTTTSYITGIKVSPGVWHHAAFTFGADGAATLYLDYVKVGSGKYTGKRLYTYESRALTIGANNGTQKRTFPGDIMEVRVSDVALPPERFLRLREAPRPSGADTATIAHMHFDGDYSVAPYHLCPTNGWGVAREGGNAPAFSDAVPGTGKIALDGEAMQDVRRSARSLYMDGSQVRFSRLSLAERRKFTVECFAKITAADKGVGFLRQGRLSGNYEKDAPRWMLYLSPNANQENQMWLAVAKENTARNDVAFTVLDGLFADGRWHHYALTFDETVSGTDTTNAVIELWRDYRSYGAKTIAGRLEIPTAECTFTIGANNSFTGWVDELRISDGVLPVSAFMRRVPRGITLNFR